MSTNAKLAQSVRDIDAVLRVEGADLEIGSRRLLKGVQSAVRDAIEAIAAHDAEQAALRDLECPPDPEMVDRALAAADQKRAYALAARQQAQVPEGFVLVPVEPTPEMKTAGLNVEVYQDSPPEPESLTWAEVRAIYRAMLSAAPRPEAVAGWQPISTAPKDGRKMLLFYLNANGQARRVIGGWVTAEEAAETDADDVGLEAGWYERIDNWPDYYQVAINEGEPTHWMPLPAAPQEPTHG